MVYETIDSASRVQFLKVIKSGEFGGYDLFHYDYPSNEWVFVQNFDEKSWAIHWINTYNKNMRELRAMAYATSLAGPLVSGGAE
jgi:hypothetical protein